MAARGKGEIQFFIKFVFGGFFHLPNDERPQEKKVQKLSGSSMVKADPTTNYRSPINAPSPTPARLMRCFSSEAVLLFCWKILLAGTQYAGTAGSQPVLRPIRCEPSSQLVLQRETVAEVAEMANTRRATLPYPREESFPLSPSTVKASSPTRHPLPPSFSVLVALPLL